MNMLPELRTVDQNTAGYRRGVTFFRAAGRHLRLRLANGRNFLVTRDEVAWAKMAIMFCCIECAFFQAGAIRSVL